MKAPKKGQPEWDAEETIVEIGRRPSLVVRLDLSGNFPIRALCLIVSIGDISSIFTDITSDGRFARAYFPVVLPDDAEIRWGDSEQGLIHVYPERFSARRIRRMDPSSIPAAARIVRDLESLRPAP